MESARKGRESAMVMVSRLALTLIPCAVLLVLIFAYKVDVPFWDAWDWIISLEKSYEGTLTFGDLWSQHNEHRLLFAKVVLMPWIRLSGWNVTYTLLPNVLVAIGTFAVLRQQVKATSKQLGDAGMLWLIPALSLCVFSLQQSENWLWDIEVSLFMSTFAVVAALIMLSAPTVSWRRFALSATLGVIGSYSFSNALLLWPVGLVVLALRAAPTKRIRVIWMAVWALAGYLVTALYLYGYHKPTQHPSLWVLGEQPVQYVQYVLTYLGASVVNFNQRGALWTGLVGLVGFVLAVLEFWRSTSGTQRAVLPYVTLGAFYIGSALLVGIGRLGFGVPQAMAPRYVTICYPFWIANLVLWYLLMCGRGTMRIDSVRIVWGAAFACLLILTACSSMNAWKWFRLHHDSLSEARTELLSPKHPELLGRLYPVTSRIRNEWLPILKRRRLSVYRESAASEAGKIGNGSNFSVS